MMQIISGTIKNAVKLDMLTKDWEEKKKTNNILLKQQKNNQANMSPEMKMLEQFKEQMLHDREQSKNNEIAYKIMNGDDLTPEEEQYLAQNNPGQLSNYRQVRAERRAYEEKLQKCKTKDEVQRLKTNTMNAYLSELKAARGEAKAAKAMEILGKVRNIQKAELHFIESGGYAKLPTEADEAKDRAEERNREKEEALEILEEAADAEESVDYEYETEEIYDETTDEEKIKIEKPKLDSKNEIINDNGVRINKNKKESESKKKADDPLEEIETICKKYIANVDNKLKEKPKVLKNESKEGRQIDLML